jgi:hypothetical protein
MFTSYHCAFVLFSGPTQDTEIAEQPSGEGGSAVQAPQANPAATANVRLPSAPVGGDPIPPPPPGPPPVAKVQHGSKGTNTGKGKGGVKGLLIPPPPPSADGIVRQGQLFGSNVVNKPSKLFSNFEAGKTRKKRSDAGTKRARSSTEKSTREKKQAREGPAAQRSLSKWREGLPKITPFIKGASAA